MRSYWITTNVGPLLTMKSFPHRCQSFWKHRPRLVPQAVYPSTRLGIAACMAMLRLHFRIQSSWKVTLSKPQFVTTVFLGLIKSTNWFLSLWLLGRSSWSMHPCSGSNSSIARFDGETCQRARECLGGLLPSRILKFFKVFFRHSYVCVCLFASWVSPCLTWCPCFICRDITFTLVQQTLWETCQSQTSPSSVAVLFALGEQRRQGRHRLLAST